MLSLFPFCNVLGSSRRTHLLTLPSKLSSVLILLLAMKVSKVVFVCLPICSNSIIGSNYSAGEKQLLALCRALVKNSRIIILDEATSSVDVETDSKVQRTIHNEFATSTLLCIAHRLNTIGEWGYAVSFSLILIRRSHSPL